MRGPERLSNLNQFPGVASGFSSRARGSFLNIPAMPETNACERLVDEFVELLAGPGFRRRLSAAFRLLQTVHGNLELGAEAREQDVRGFRADLVENNQRGEAIRHLRFHAGLILLGPAGWPPSWTFHFLDWIQARRGRPESMTEMADNRAGRNVGRLMIQGFKGQLTRESLREAILRELAEEG